MAGQGDLSTCIQVTIFFSLGVQLASKKDKNLYKVGTIQNDKAEFKDASVLLWNTHASKPTNI